MPIKYISKQRTLSGFVESPIAQLINVPSLQLCMRCQYCQYWESDRDYNDMITCSSKHKCGLESLLWARMTNGYGQGEIQGKHFTPTTIVRQRKFSEVPRYLQYFTCDLEGYICNRLCQFYPKRIEDDQSVAECANSNNCGQNGSFFRLLEMVRQDLSSLPQFYNYRAPVGYILQYNGQLVPTSIAGTAGWDSNGLFILTGTDGIERRVLLMFTSQPNSGCFLCKHDENPDLYLFDYIAVSYDRIRPTDFVLLNIREDLWSILNDAGITTDAIDNIYKHLTQLSWGTSNRAWVTSNDSFQNFIDLGTNFLVAIDTIDTGEQLIFKFGSSGNTYLMSPFRGLPPAKWRKVKLTAAPSGSYTTITLTSYISSTANWLRQIGVRESLFYDL